MTMEELSILIGYSLPRNKRTSLATEALASLWQEHTGRVGSEYAQQTIGNKGRSWHWVAKKERQDLYLKNILYQSPMCKNMLALPLL